jgi:two-component system cell cycle sensor histidine kinase/response regulator CckA
MASLEQAAGSKKLRILYAEDRVEDMELALLELKKAGIAVIADRIQTPTEMLALLVTHTYDLVLSDYRIPGWNGMEVLVQLRNAGIDIPFILVTGTLGDVAAVECIKHGAWDYVMKDSLARLPHAVVRSLKEYQGHLLHKQADERLRLAVEASELSFWDCDLITGKVYLSEAWSAMRGGKPKEISTTVQDLLSISHPDDKENMFKVAMQAVAGETSSYREQHRVQSVHGGWIWVESTGRVVEREPNGRVRRMIGTNMDISERKQNEETLHMSEVRLHAAQRMEAVGQLAGGVAHDFNNLLTVIRGHTEILLKQLGDDASALHDVKAIQKASDRAASITRQLLAFGRKQVLQPRVLDLYTVLAEISEMLRTVVGSDILLHLNMEPESIWVKADEGQIEQVVVNLVINARDAMPQGGTLTVEASHIAVGKDFVRQDTPMPEGKYARLAVRDTGFGMDVATKTRIFEPFFTTKAIGRGTGLGLSTVYGIVKQSGGWIWADSEPGRGASFEVFLPEVPAPETLAHSEPAAVDHGVREQETILVVDDEDALRDMVVRFLGSKGYTVLSAENGKTAIEISLDQEIPIHLLITDIVMPGMDGETVARRVSELRPGIKVLYISGYAKSVAALKETLERGEAFMQKPFTLDALASKLREIFAETPALPR